MLFSQFAPAQCRILLKFFQITGKFPKGRMDVPRQAVAHLANELGKSVSDFAQFIRICRWLKLIHENRLAPLYNTPFSTPWARKRYSVAQRFR